MWMREIRNIKEISSPDLSDLHSLHTNFVHSSIGIVNDTLKCGHCTGHLFRYICTVLDDIQIHLGQIETIGDEMAARLNNL